MRTSNYLPIRPRLIDGEALSSYLSRISYEYGLSVPDFLSSLSVRNTAKSVTVERLDDLVPSKLIELLSSCTPNSREEFMLAGIHCLIGTVTSKTHPLHRNDWLFTPDTYPDKPDKDRFTQYCPACLDDPNAHFKILWRWSAMTACTTHQVLLEWLCPHCSSPVVPYLHVVKAGRKFGFRIHECAFCGGDLRLAGSPPLQAVMSPRQVQILLSFQQLNLTLLRVARRLKSHTTLQYFGVVDALLKAIVPKPAKRITRHQELFDSLLYACDLQTFQLGMPVTINHRSFDCTPPSERSRVLLMVSLLLESWPENLKSLWSRSKILQDVIDESTLTGSIWQVEGTDTKASRSYKPLRSSLGQLCVKAMLKTDPFLSDGNKDSRWFSGPQDLGNLSDHFLGWQKTRLDELEARFGNQARYQLSTYRRPKKSTLLKKPVPQFLF